MYRDRKTERLIVLIEPALMTWLRKRSKRSGLSLAELTRRALLERMTDTGTARQQYDIEDLGEEVEQQQEEVKPCIT